MTLPDPIPAEDAAALVRAIEDASARLQRGGLAVGEAEEIARTITSHLRHPRAKVRQAVAEAAKHLPEEAFEEAIGVLLGDANQWVKNLATTSFDARSKRRREVQAHAEASASVRALREWIEGELKAPSLRAADRLADLAKDEMMAQLHHELAKVATPLRLTLAEMRDEARRAYGGAAAGRAESALTMLDSLMAIALSMRAHTRAAEPKYRDESLRAVAEEHVALLRARVGDARRARLSVDVEVDEGLAAEIDRGLFGQAVSNMLQNAVEAYPEEGTGEIRVRVVGVTRDARTRVGIAVQDFGRGMPEETRVNLGAPFTSTKGRGRGLGVLNVKKMVETVHGGRVEVKSTEGKGTRVTVVVPRRQ